jgi:hypothetical protein
LASTDAEGAASPILKPPIHFRFPTAMPLPALFTCLLALKVDILAVVLAQTSSGVGRSAFGKASRCKRNNQQQLN